MIQFIKKKRTQILLAVTLLFISLNASAQTTAPINEPDYNQSLAFASAPDSVLINISLLETLFSKQPGERIAIQTGTSFVPEGILQSVVSKYNDMITTAVLKLSSADDLLLVFSRIQLQTGKTAYRCHITGKDKGDCFVMAEKNNQYILIKKNIHSLRAE